MNVSALSAEARALIEAPLQALDPTIEAFARQHSLTLARNSHEGIERSLHWGRRPALLIQVFVESLESPSYTLWVCATDDRPRHEYWLHETLAKALSASQLASLKFQELLEHAHNKAELWRAGYSRPA